MWGWYPGGHYELGSVINFPNEYLRKNSVLSLELWVNYEGRRFGSQKNFLERDWSFFHFKGVYVGRLAKMGCEAGRFNFKKLKCILNLARLHSCYNTDYAVICLYYYIGALNSMLISCHVRVSEWIYTLNVKELLARNKHDIWSLSHRNGIRGVEIFKEGLTPWRTPCNIQNIATFWLWNKSLITQFIFNTKQCIF